MSRMYLTKEEIAIRFALVEALKRLGTNQIEVDLIACDFRRPPHILVRDPLDRLQRQMVVVALDLELPAEPTFVDVQVVEPEILAIAPAPLLIEKKTAEVTWTGVEKRVTEFMDDLVNLARINPFKEVGSAEVKEDE